jgi:hypothetical protein
MIVGNLPQKVVLSLGLALSKETSVNPEKWSRRNPTAGHCFVVSYVIWEKYGGHLIRAILENGDTHYWNVLADGQEIDLTRDQYGDKFVVQSWERITNPESKLEGHPDTVRRLNLYRDRVNKIMETIV